MRARGMAVGAVLLALAVAACGGNDNADDHDGSTGTGSNKLTIYSSMPLDGASRDQAASIIDAEKLALNDAGGRVGPFTIRFAVLDDASSSDRHWTPEATASAARKAAQDKSTIGYLGELDSGASAISIPILNETGILQVSPASTYVGLTRPDVEKGTPDKYYPSGKRNFGRVVPSDRIQAAAQVAYQRTTGCTKTFIINDGDVYGTGLAAQVVAAAKGHGLQIVGNETMRVKGQSYRDQGDQVSATGADCIMVAAIVDHDAVRLFKDLHATNPSALLFGGDRLAVAAFTRNLGPSVADMTYLTSPGMAPALYPKAGREFFRRYRARFHAQPDPYAIFGYEAMSVVLRAIHDARAHGNDRQAVTEAFFKIKNRRSVLGTYSIDKSGDTTLTTYSGYRVRHGRLAFDETLPPAS